MSLKRRLVVAVLLATCVLAAAAFLVARYQCPAEGIAFSQARRELHRLKNRNHLPQSGDFDNNVTLEKILKPGDDRTRWSVNRAARLEGYVVAVEEAHVELANCYVRRDIHIDVALHADAPGRERIVLEVTPRMQDWARSQGWNWSQRKLKQDLLGRWCYFEGWLFFDRGHVEEAENTAPGKPGNWRATAWEIHPITKLTVKGP